MCKICMSWQRDAACTKEASRVEAESAVLGLDLVSVSVYVVWGTMQRPPWIMACGTQCLLV